MQLRVQAFDSDNPSKRAETRVMISVTRNEHAPVFKEDEYVVSAVENFPIGASVARVEAIDDDGDAVRYVIDASEQDDVASFFFVHPFSGVLSVTRALSEWRESQLSVRVRASDDRRHGARNATTLVTVVITRDESLPEFVDLPERVQVSENTLVNAVVLTLTATDSDLQVR